MYDRDLCEVIKNLLLINPRNHWNAATAYENIIHIMEIKNIK